MENVFDGSIALVCNGYSCWFKDWIMEGSRLRVENRHTLGPEIGTLYTLSEGVLRLTAQLPPISESDEQEAFLQIHPGG